MVLQQVLLESRTPEHVLGDDNPMLVRDRERTSIEQFVVQGAECQSVGFGIRATGLMPHDMGGFQGQVRVAKAQVKSADGASMFVRAKDFFAKGRIAFCASIRAEIQIQANLGQDVFVNRVGKMLFQQKPRKFNDQLRAPAQSLPYFRSEGTGRVDFPEGRDLGIGIGCSPVQILMIRDMPDLVGL